MPDELIGQDLTPEDGAGDPEGATFEDFGHDNGYRYWWRSDLMWLLGYDKADAFNRVVGKAMAACTTLDIPVQGNFDHVKRTIGGADFEDCKLSRFACYLVAMNGDPRKAEVAKAQGYFARLAEATRQLALQADQVERVMLRDEITTGEKLLSATAHSAGVSDYALFQNKGYRGLYNMNLRELKTQKGVDGKKTLLDFMGKEELAANYFRITQTDAKIRKDNVRGQHRLEDAAFRVGREVREAIEKIGGTMPEQLKPADDIAKVRSGLKRAQREMSKIDEKKALPPGKKKGK